MSRILALTACLLAIAFATSTWIWWPRETTDTTQSQSFQQPSSLRQDSANNRTSNRADSPRENYGDVDVTRISLEPAKNTNQTKVLRLQLRGLHRKNPWTSPLHFRFGDSSRGINEPERSSPVSIDGLCLITLPTWWRDNTLVTLQVDGDSNGYREFRYHKRNKLDLSQRIVVDVQPIASLTGTVTNGRGEPVEHARISAFATKSNQPFGNSIATTSTNNRGCYSLNAPPDIPLLITATAMQANALWPQVGLRVTDNGQLRADLLPAGQPTQLAVEKAIADCDFKLNDAAIVTGRVQWPDCAPIAGAEVRFSGPGSTRLRVSRYAAINWQPNGSLVACGIATTDNQGQFTVPTNSSAQIDLAVVSLTHAKIVGELFTQGVVAPHESLYTVPFPVTLRAVHKGQLVPYAHMLMEGMRPLRAREDGTLNVVITQGAKVRAEQGSLRSKWRFVAANHLKQTVDLTMVNQLSELHVALEGDIPVHDATFSWRCEDGRASTDLLHRKDHDEPFQLWLEPGRYELTVGPTSGDRNASFLLPIVRNVDISKPRATTRLKLPSKFGGYLSLQVLDENGRFVAGNCKIRGPDGKIRPIRMHLDGLPGAFLAETSNCPEVLPTGPYELIVNLDNQVTHKRYFTILKCKTTTVVLRL